MTAYLVPPLSGGDEGGGGVEVVVTELPEEAEGSRG